MNYKITDNEGLGFFEGVEGSKKYLLALINNHRYSSDEYLFRSLKEAINELNLTLIKS